MKTPREIYSEALSGINIQENEKLILNSNDGYYIYRFAKDVKDANILALEEALLKTKYVIGFLYFAEFVKGSNKQKLSDAVLETFNYDLIKAYYDHIDFDKTRYDNYFRNLIFL